LVVSSCASSICLLPSSSTQGLSACSCVSN
jgi:hypothetical protein